MNILVAKNGSQLGPFSESDLRTKLSGGEFSLTDLAWHEGMTTWSPLSQVLGEAMPSASASSFPTPSAAIEPAYAAPSQPPQPYGTPPPDNSPYPQAYQPGAMPPWGAQAAGSYAGFWLRVVAYLIDAVLLYIPSYIIARILLAMHLGMLVNILNLAIFVAYYSVMEASARQATVGKMAIGLRVTDEAGNRLSIGNAVGRNLGKIVSGITLLIGFIMAGFTQRKQALHDLMAHTLVVRK